MHRVELKVFEGGLFYFAKGQFLMHRVELKAQIVVFASLIISAVPNAPCGVERPFKLSICASAALFLMHRVELKERWMF